jgi:hypothetical protein
MLFTEAIQEHIRNRKLRNGDWKHLPVFKRLSAMLGVNTPSPAQIEIDEDAVRRIIQICDQRVKSTHLIIGHLSMIGELEKALKIYTLASINRNLPQNQRERIQLTIRDITKRKDELWGEIHTYVVILREL